MFDHVFTAEVQRIETLVPKVDGPVKKVCRVTFRRDLDDDIARALGGKFGTDALQQLHDRGITQVTFPIDSVTARAKLRGDKDEVIELGVVTGIKAVAKAKKLQEDKEPDEPSVSLKFQFDFSPEAWLFFGRNACATIDVTLSKSQLSLPLEERKVEVPPKANGRKRKARDGEKTAADAGGEVPTDIAERREREERMADEEAWATPPGMS